MIEFKGAYFQKGRCTPLSVLVQFDGILLHVWHISDPFHRLLTSDVFRLPSSIGRRRHQIRLPNGGRIETDDIQALDRIQEKSASSRVSLASQSVMIKIMAAGGVFLLLAGAFLIAGHILMQ